MPLTRENRYLLELAIIAYLKSDVREATSKDIYHHLKSRGILALKGTKQVSMICLGFERKGVLLSRWVKVREKLRAYQKKCWRINPDFYKDYPNQSMFTFHYSGLEKIRNIRKRRTKRIGK